ncbi:hypothetical protein ACHAW5_003219 [Stephanodiscus triporus]|uniref:Uncharacterized protein n=1 Tax=Stephanodiscus triporus TaxID=2934178 RepID=A0ABD3PK72_9STRA
MARLTFKLIYLVLVSMKFLLSLVLFSALTIAFMVFIICSFRLADLRRSIGAVSLSGGKPEVVAGSYANPALGEITSAVRGRGATSITSASASGKCGDAEFAKSLLGESPSTGIPCAKKGAPRVLSRCHGPRHKGSRPAHGRVARPRPWHGLHNENSAPISRLGPERVGCRADGDYRGGGRFREQLDGTRADITSRDIIMTPSRVRGGETLEDEILEVLVDSDCLRY